MRGAIVLLTLGAGAGVYAASTGCLRSTQYQCNTSAQCTSDGVQGRCETGGLCSFPDSRCESGYRFGELAGAQSNQCVGAVVVDAAVPIDAPPDAPPDAYVHDARECFGGGAYELCFAMMPPMGMVALEGTLDTTTDPRCVPMPQSWIDAGQPDACMVIGRQIDVTATLVVTGTRPLVLVGDVVNVAAVIDIASHRGGTIAAAANATQCAAFGAAAVDDATGGGGGAGGSFMTAGGNGGRGQSATAAGGTAAPADATAPMVLRGGCAGQSGGTGTAAAGAPGPGGGAIYIAAGRLSIPTSGAINASGAGGSGGGTFSGGSGAGAGGMIVIHAVELGILAGKLVANGGGGASGGDSNDAGVPGEDPVVATVTTPAPGGIGGGGGGSNGGSGFAGVNQAQPGLGAQNNKAGGGGGGGGGYIQSNVALAGLAASPAVTVVP